MAGLGALGVVWGVALAASDRLGRRAVGSVLVTGGLFAVFVGFNVAVVEGVVEALLVAGASWRSSPSAPPGSTRRPTGRRSPGRFAIPR
ncbi:hypothetical protein ACFQMM_21675 [Saliphagus sp. GCM10025308]